VDDSRDISFISTGLEVLEVYGAHVRVIQYPKVPGNFFMGYMFGKTEKDGTDVYTISIYGKSMSRKHFWQILAHELIHVKQLHSGRFDYLEELGEIYWEGDTLTFKDTNYDDRPWEIEAFSKSDSVANVIRNELRWKKVKAGKKRLERFQRDIEKAVGLD
jgi:hypothetical protein